jgi:hypothetical protein
LPVRSMACMPPWSPSFPPDRQPSAMPTWLLAGPSRNWCCATSSSDRTKRGDDRSELRGLREFAARHRLQRRPLVTTLTRTARGSDGQMEIDFVPTSLHCYTMARNLLRASAWRTLGVRLRAKSPPMRCEQLARASR